MRKIVLIIIALIALLLTLLASVNVLWIVTFVVAIIIGVAIVFFLRKHKFAKPIALGVSVIILSMGWYSGLVDTPDQMSITKVVYVPLLKDTTQPEYSLKPQVNPLEDDKRDFDDTRYYQYKPRIEAIRRASIFQSDALQILIRARNEGIGNSNLQSTLDRAIGELDKSITQHWDVSRLQKIEKLLEVTRKNIQISKDSNAIEEMKNEFDKNYADITLDKIYENYTQVRVALNALMKDKLNGMLQFETHLVARVDEVKKQLILDEQLLFKAEKPIVKRVDLTDLVRLTNFRGFDEESVKKEILLSYDGCTNPTVFNSEPNKKVKVTIQRGQQEFCVINRIIVPINIDEVGKRWQLLRFPSFTLRWPQIYDAKVFLDLTFDDKNITERRVPHAIEIKRNRPIEQLTLPRNSFFHATTTAKHKVFPDRDDVVLEKSDNTITPEFFRQYPYVWIELLPNSVFFRNTLVQKVKSYLFPENALMFLLVAIIGAILGIILGPETKKA